MTGPDERPGPAAPGVWDLRHLVGDLADQPAAMPPTEPATMPQSRPAPGSRPGQPAAAAGLPSGAPAAAGGARPDGASPDTGPAHVTPETGPVGGTPVSGGPPDAGPVGGAPETGPVVRAEPGLVAGWLAGSGSGAGLGRAAALPRLAGLAGVMVLVVLAISAAVVLAGGDGSDGDASPASGVPGPQLAEPTAWPAPETAPAGPDWSETPAGAGWTATPTGPDWTGTPAPGWTTAPGDPGSTGGAEAAALATLHELRLADQPLIRLDGRYAAQLASKSVGIVDPRQVAANGSHTFYAVDILAEHRRIRAEATPTAPVVLLLSTDVGKRQLYRGQPLWITVALVGADRPAEVVAWCADRFPELTGATLTNRCLPRRMEA